MYLFFFLLLLIKTDHYIILRDLPILYFLFTNAVSDMKAIKLNIFISAKPNINFFYNAVMYSVTRYCKIFKKVKYNVPILS